MTDRYYLTGGGHVLISGPTGAGPQYGGKSSTANWWLDYLYRSGERDVTVAIDAGNAGYNGTPVRTIQGMMQSYRAGKRQFVWARESGITDVVTFVDELPGSAAIAFDEAWMYPDSEGMINTVRNLGNQEDPVMGLVVSQRAWDLPDAIRNSCPLKVWVGPMTNEGEQYFRSAGMKHVADALKGQMEPYHWAVTDGGELIHTNEPVPEEYA